MPLHGFVTCSDADSITRSWQRRPWRLTFNARFKKIEREGPPTLDVTSNVTIPVTLP